MNCGFTGVYGYTESDENTYARKRRKYNSIPAEKPAPVFAAFGSPGGL